MVQKSDYSDGLLDDSKTEVKRVDEVVLPDKRKKRNVASPVVDGYNPQAYRYLDEDKRTFWMARGKKQSDENDSLDAHDTETYKNVFDYDTKNMEHGSGNVDYETINTENGQLITGKRKDAPFWAMRGKRPEDGSAEDYAEMSRWLAAAPKLALDIARRMRAGSQLSAMSRGAGTDGRTANRFSRLARFVNDNQSNDEKNPDFWVVRGKKAVDPANEEAEKNSSEDTSVLTARMKKPYRYFWPRLNRFIQQRSYKPQKYWVNRGRKSFWASRGK